MTHRAKKTSAVSVRFLGLIDHTATEWPYDNRKKTGRGAVRLSGSLPERIRVAYAVYS
jgi:hypothetical protein